MNTLASAPAPTLTSDIIERHERGLIILSSSQVPVHRRVLYVNSYGGRDIWTQVKNGSKASHHLWGCVQLVRMGYEVALAEPLPDFYLHRKPFPHDLRMLSLAREWLGRDGILYCGHNVLYWLPLLKWLGAIRCAVVSLLFAREPLDWRRGHTGIIALNPVAAEHAAELAPKVKRVHLGWGFDQELFPQLPYSPAWLLSCGITQRDHRTLHAASLQCTARIRIISPNLPADLRWPDNVTLITGGRHDDTVPYSDLLRDHYARCTASLIILKNDPKQETAVGFTNLLEAMAMGRPVIVSRTGALATELDVEAAGCGLHVPPDNPGALARAIQSLAAEPERARAMGEKGRMLARSHYHIDRFARDLHRFFESI